MTFENEKELIEALQEFKIEFPCEIIQVSPEKDKKNIKIVFTKVNGEERTEFVRDFLPFEDVNYLAEILKKEGEESYELKSI